MHFGHTFADGRIMTITCVRKRNKLPELICVPQFCGAEDEATLTEYAIWRSYIFDVMLQVMSDEEILAVAKHGQQIE